MNRSATAITCLERLAAQTRCPDRVIVINNASTDDTVERLQAFSDSHEKFPIVRHDLPENLGNAGGMELGFERAFSENADAVWILDDDSWPEPAALEYLLAAELPHPCVRSCKVVDLATGKLSWPLQISKEDGWEMAEGDDPLPDFPSVRIRRSWLGALIPKEIHDKVGPINGRLFLRGEDEDYPRRIENHGFTVHMITGSILHHPPAGKLNRIRFLGREMVLEHGLSGDKLYYRLRNSWWITKRDKNLLQMLATCVLHFLILLKAEGMRNSWISVWFEAFRDATCNRLGKRNSKTL